MSEEEQPKRGFAALKEKNPERFHEIQQKGVEASVQSRTGHGIGEGESRTSGAGGREEESSGGEGKRGFAALKERDPEKFHEIQQKGVEASVQSRTGHGLGERELRSSGAGEGENEGGEDKRGFAALKEKDPEKFHEIQQKGVEASAQSRKGDKRIE
jgi:mannose/fructose/N-acetylgalactosamine-specific phosphotransferase system component IIB